MMIRLLLVFTLLISLPSCKNKEQVNERKPTVLVSVPPYAFFVKKIAGNAVEIETLVPVGANPHIYEASPKQVMRHQNADLWIYLGEPFDKKVLKFFNETNKPIQILDITKGIPLLSVCEEEGLETEAHHCHLSHEEGYDLHLWLSPSLAKIQAQKIASALSSLIPEQKEIFTVNLQLFLKELEDLDQRIGHLLKPLAGKAILVSHPAFGYFCKDYHLIQLSIEIEGKDPLPQHITEILEQTKHYVIKSVLIEPQYSNKGAELMAQSLHLPIHMVDPYAENYTENLLLIAKVIAE
jgi:zinc transport system substrate-binding protein